MNATKQSTHTPGPWTNRNRDHIDGADGTCVACVNRPEGGNSDVENANARLIAAAPDLLAALRELVNRCWLDTDRRVYSLDSKGCGADVAALDAARSAIARATA